MKTFIVILAVFIAIGSSVNISANTPELKQWNSLKLGESWAKVILNFAELKNLSGGALEDLSQAIEDLLEDLSNKSQRATDEFNQRTTDHESEVDRLNKEIDSANLDISSTQEFLDSVLYVQRADLESSIEQLERDIENTQTYIQEETSLREQQVIQFNTKIAEHQDAIAAVSECIALLAQLHEDGQLSLVQVSNAKTQFERLQQKLGNSADATLIQSLVALASGQFTDATALANVENLLSEVQNNLIASVAKFNDEEQAAIQAYEADIAAKKADINRMIMEKTDNTAQLERTNEQIANAEQFVLDRQQDLEEWLEDLAQENTSYEIATQNYNDLIDQINKEINACERALELVQNANIAGYIENRTDQDVVIDQANGTGIVVNDDEI